MKDQEERGPLNTGTVNPPAWVGKESSETKNIPSIKSWSHGPGNHSKKPNVCPKNESLIKQQTKKSQKPTHYRHMGIGKTCGKRPQNKVPEGW